MYRVGCIKMIRNILFRKSSTANISYWTLACVWPDWQINWNQQQGFSRRATLPFYFNKTRRKIIILNIFRLWKRLEESLRRAAFTWILPGREIESSKLVVFLLLKQNHKKKLSPSNCWTLGNGPLFFSYRSPGPLINTFIVYPSDRLVLLMAFSSLKTF